MDEADLPSIGDALLSGYYAGIIDTTAGNIESGDKSKTGARYALIVSPQTLENRTNEEYSTTLNAAPTGAQTRWDGLTATAALNSSLYPAAQYCAGLTYPSDDGASAWYLPAMDELELIYRNLKPVTTTNYVGAVSGAYTFPASGHNSGYNPSSDPPGAAYTTTSPAQTSVAVFKSGGGQALGAPNGRYWSVTESETGNAWAEGMNGGVLAAGSQLSLGKHNTGTLRPVRRVLLTTAPPPSSIPWLGTGTARPWLGPDTPTWLGAAT